MRAARRPPGRTFLLHEEGVGQGSALFILRECGRTRDLAALVDHDRGRAAVEHGRLICTVLLHDLAAALDGNAERVELAAVDDEHEHRAVLGLTDGGARLLIVQTRTGHKVLAVDDERRMELDRVAQPARVRKLADLKMIALVKADDLPAIADRALNFRALALEEAVGQAARAVALVIREAGRIDAERCAVSVRNFGNI